MPLIHSKSNKALQQNMRTLHSEIGKSPHVQSRKQAIAIALETQRRGKQAGGGVEKLKSAMRHPFAPYLQAEQGEQMNRVYQRVRPNAPRDVQEVIVDDKAKRLPWEMASGGGGPLGSGSPWYERRAMNKLFHEGQINSAVPGRTDKHSLSVPAGAYVLPADTVSHIGQNNSTAGGNILNRLFGRTGRVGGRTRINAVSLPRKIFSKGGRHEGNVPILAAGGEFVIHPDVVMEIGDGDMKLGHSRLDKFVELIRKKHIKTLKKLPKPKKT